MARRKQARSPLALREHNRNSNRLARCGAWVAVLCTVIFADRATNAINEPINPVQIEKEVPRLPSLEHHGAAGKEMVGATDGAGVSSPIDPRLDRDIERVGNRSYRAARVITMRVTAYSPDARSCGKFADGITASGRPVTANGGRLVAADTRLLPFGTLVSVPGYGNGHPVPVLDRGGAIKGNRLDVLFTTHERAMKWGVQHLDVIIWEEVGNSGSSQLALRR